VQAGTGGSSHTQVSGCGRQLSTGLKEARSHLSEQQEEAREYHGGGAAARESPEEGDEEEEEEESRAAAFGKEKRKAEVVHDLPPRKRKRRRRKATHECGERWCDKSWPLLEEKVSFVFLSYQMTTASMLGTQLL